MDISPAVLLGWVSPPIGAVLAALVLVPYLAIVIGGGGQSGDQAPKQPRPDHPVRGLLTLVVLDASLIIAGSFGMVEAGLALGDNLHLPRVILGVLVLAPLTSIPNAVTGVRLRRV